MPRIKSSGPEPTYKPSTGHGHSGHFNPVADRHREPPLPSGQAAPKRESRSTDRQRTPCAAASGLIHPKPAATPVRHSAPPPCHPPATATTTTTTNAHRPTCLVDPHRRSKRASRTSHLAPRASNQRTNERSLEIVRSERRTTGQPTTRWKTLYFTACLIFKLAFIRPPPWSPAGHRGKTTPGSVSAQSLRSVSPPSGKGSAVL